VAADGSIWVCGSSDDYLGTSDIYRGVLVRWSPTGDETWASIGSATKPATFYNVAVDPSGNAYVAGSILRGASSDGFAAKFTPAGTRSWISYVSLTSRTDDLLEDVAVGPSGTVYATGTLNEGMARNSRAVVLRLKR
jgi:hypothetical protein